MWTCLVDLRCLQDPSYRDRGIGRHARALLVNARAYLPGARLIGLFDETMPGLADDLRALVDGCRTNAYTGALREPCAFVQLSPMTHDPLFVARLLHHPAIPCAAAVYDFIPFNAPDTYLGAAGTRLDYHIALRWLARHQLFLPISLDAATRLKQILDVPDQRVTVTGAPLAEAFDALKPGQAKHVLVVGGGDPRKNPECAIRAHAQSSTMQAAGVPLVVTGHYAADWIADQHRVIAGLGGDPALLIAPGHIPEDRLLALYRDAWCVVAPSRAEGFSLPVIEGMAAHVPVLASNIPAHRELLDARLFGADDPVALAGLLNQVLDPSWRAEAIAAQEAVWPRFRASQVADRFWSGVRRLTPETSPATVRSRPRIALLTPLPPDRSGVADYSAGLCKTLGERADVHVFTPTQSPVHPEGATSVGPLSPLPFLSSNFDRVIATLGNSVFHLEILKLMLRYGGAAILHDGRMIDLYAGHMTLARTIGLAQAELGRGLHADEVRSWLSGDAAPAALILGEVVAAAEPLMMHSRAAIAEVERRYQSQSTHLPFALYRTVADAELSPEHRAMARARLGIAPGEIVLASFGFVHHTKAPLDCIWALDLLRSWGVPARLHFVGAPLMPTEALVALIDRLALADHVLLSDDFVDEQSYRDHLLGADIGIQLRPGGSGSVSGALSDCIACGLRTVASDTLAAALDAPNFVIGVPDNPSPVLVAEAAMSLLGTPPTEVARKGYKATHGFDTYVAALWQALDLR